MNTDYRQKRVAEAQKFLDTLFGAVKGTRYSYLWTKQDKSSYPFIVTNADDRAEMARRAIELNDGGFDVYVGVNLGDEPTTHDKRYTKEQITVQTATVTDIDCEGGNHISNDKKVYPPNFDTAEKFLPFAPSILINSGFGLQAYCVYAEPILISGDNRVTAEERNKNFISAIRSRAGIFSGAVDGVGDLPRVLRMPGTFNYKCGTENAPLCHVVEYRDDRFTPADMDARLKSLLPPPLVSKPTTRPARQPSFSTDEPTDEERARAMLEFIPLKDLSENEWLSAVSALKNLGFSYAEVDALNQGGKHYNERENRTRWESLHDPSFDIATLHGIAKRYGYSEKDFQREWHAAHRLQAPADRRADSVPVNAENAVDAAQDAVSIQDSGFDLFSGDASDLDFAYRLENFCGERVRWLTDSERWLSFADGIWTRGSEKNSAIINFGRELANEMARRARSKYERELAAKLKSAKKIGNAIGLLKSCDSIRITQEDLDAHSNFLSVLNGVVDLETGILMDADPKLLITRQCRAEYHANAHSELVDKFFRNIQPDEMTREGLLRWLGYCLTGETSEEKFMVCHGDGANGKGVLSKTMLALLGTYGVGLTPRALLKSNRPADADKATTALNALEGVRFAISEELPADAELDASLVKNLTGGDDINLRKNYSEYRTIPNYAKLNISGNYLPRIENTSDDGILRRLLNMPFTVQFGVDAPADPALKKKMLLPENLNALLAILVREAVNWYSCYNSEESGLIVSSLMKQENARQLAQSNFVADFIADAYPRDREHEVKAKEFIDRLKAEYPRETQRFKRADLIKLITSIDGVTYIEGKQHNRVIKISRTTD